MAALSEAFEDMTTSLLQAQGKGWNAALLVDANKISEFACTSCHNICKEAVELSCDHEDEDMRLYCHDCLQAILNRNNTICPINPSHQPSDVQSLRGIRKMINKLKVICPYSAQYISHQIINMNDDGDNMVYDTLDQKEGVSAQKNDQSDCPWIGTLYELIHSHIKNCKYSSHDILEKTIETMKYRLHKLEIDVHKLQCDHLSKTDDAIDNITHEISNLQGLNDTISQRQNDMKSSIVSMEQNIQILEQAINSSNCEIDTLKQALKDKDNQIKNNTTQLSNMKEIIDDLKMHEQTEEYWSHQTSVPTGSEGQTSVPMLDINPLTTDMLQGLKPAKQKRMIGERLFPKIQKVQPRLAGKITGMLLEMDNTELLELLSERNTLMNKINEAVAVWNEHQQKTSSQNEII